MTKETYRDVFMFKTSSDLLNRVLMVDFDVIASSNDCVYQFDLKKVIEYAYPSFFRPTFSDEELQLIEQQLAIRFFNQFEE